MSPRHAPLTIALIVATLLLAATATAESIPFTNKALNNTSVLEMLNTSNALYLLVATDSNAKLLSAELNNTLPLPNLTTTTLSVYSQKPSLATVSSLREPRYAAIALPSGEISIIDLRTNAQRIFAVPGAPLAMTYVGDTLLLLAENRGARILYAFAPTRLGWYEARLRVGNLLPNRQENIMPLNLAPVYTLKNGYIDAGDAALLVAERRVVNASTSAVLAGVVFKEGINNTLQPVSNASIYIVDPVLGAFIGTAVTSPTGSFNAPLPQNFEQVILYVSTDGSCYSFVVTKSDVVKARDDLFILNRPLIITMGMPSTLCPSQQRSYILYLVERGGEPLRPRFRVVNYNVTTTELNILLSYIKDDMLYLFTAQPTNSQDIILTVATFNTRTLELVENATRTYYLPSMPTTAAVSPDGTIAAVACSDGLLLVLANTLGTYELVWSINIGGMASGIVVKPLPRGGTYVVAAVTENGNLAVSYIDPEAQTAWPFTYSGGQPFIHVGYSFTGVTVRGDTLIVGTQRHGALLVAGITSMVSSQSIESLSPYMVTRLPLQVVDELNRPLKSFEVYYTGYVDMGGESLVVLRGRSRGTNGVAHIQVIPMLLMRIDVIPLDAYHMNVTMKLNATRLMKDSVITVPLRLLNVTISFKDEFTGGSIAAPLSVRLQSEELGFNETFIVAPNNATLLLQLKPGIYTAEVTDLSGLYYKQLTANLNITPDKREIYVNLTRIDAVVRVILKSSHSPQPNDNLLVRLVSSDGQVLSEAQVEAPTASSPRRLAFTTKYRGDASIVVEPLPVGAGKPFYRRLSMPVTIDALRVDVEAVLEPLPYILTLRLVDEQGALVEAVYKVYMYNASRLVAEAAGREVSFTLVRGNYTVEAEPLSGNLPFPLHASVRRDVALTDNATVTLSTWTVRRLVNVSFYDPYTPDKTIIDDVSLYLDGKLVATLARGTAPSLQLPLLINGSNLTAVSSQDIYQRFSRKLVPEKDVINVPLPRRLVKAVIYVVNDVGQPVGGATVTFTGVNLRYTASTISTPDGVAEATVPYGEYRICVEAAGYNPHCITAQLTTTFKTTIVATPTLLTIIMRYSNIIAITIFAVVMIAVIRLYFRKVLEKFTTEEEF